MMQAPSLRDVLEMHRAIILHSGGALGVRDEAGLDAALAQPRLTFGGEDLYPTLVEKAAALGFSLIMNHPFLDGNKRVGHAATRLFLLRHGFAISASVDEQEAVILQLAVGELSRETWTAWLEGRLSRVRGYDDR